MVVAVAVKTQSITYCDALQTRRIRLYYLWSSVRSREHVRHTIIFRDARVAGFLCSSSQCKERGCGVGVWVREERRYLQIGRTQYVCASLSCVWRVCVCSTAVPIINGFHVFHRQPEHLVVILSLPRCNAIMWDPIVDHRDV